MLVVYYESIKRGVRKKKTQIAEKVEKETKMAMPRNILLGLLIAAALHEAGASSVLHRWYAHTSCNLFALAHALCPSFLFRAQRPLCLGHVSCHVLCHIPRRLILSERVQTLACLLTCSISLSLLFQVAPKQQTAHRRNEIAGFKQGWARHAASRRR